MNAWWLFLVAGSVAWVLTGFLRRYALNKCLMDIPNARSSHSSPTPRGGGLAVVLAFIAALPVLVWMELFAIHAVISIGGAGLLVALVGFWDDHRHIAARWRLLVHFAAVTWGLYWLGGFPAVVVWGAVYDPGWIGQLLAAIYLVWLLNLYNFMDGIDGIAGIEAVTVCLGGAILYWIAAPGESAWTGMLLLLSVVAGFLIWNFPRAKIFMGDAGSGFIGIVLGLFSLQAATIEPHLLWAWLILLGAFIVDATVTLLRRLLAGQKIYQAHRSHAYQYASRKLGSHKPVSLVFGFINLCWLLPIALCVAVAWLDGLLGVLLAYMPLIILAYYLKAGAAHLQEV